MKKYKILIFDLDDTLIDNKENIRYAFRKMIESRQDSYSDESFLRWYEIDKKFWKDRQDGFIEIPEHLKEEEKKEQKSEYFLDWLRSQRVLLYYNHTISLEEAIHLHHIYMDSLTEIVIEIDGAQETLQYLNTKYTIVIASNGPRVAAKAKVEKIHCLEYISELFTSDMVGYMKPRKEFFEAIEAKLGNFNKEDYLMIGDSLKSDIGFARQSGIDSCWLQQVKEEPSEEPTMIITKLTDLQTLL